MPGFSGLPLVIEPSDLFARLNAPELILVSAGFDAHKADPLAQMELDEADFAWAASRLREVSLRHCEGKLVSTLEGGYDLGTLARSAQAYVATLQHG